MARFAAVEACVLQLRMAKLRNVTARKVSKVHRAVTPVLVQVVQFAVDMGNACSRLLMPLQCVSATRIMQGQRALKVVQKIRVELFAMATDVVR
jgi:hypothetical protein